MHTPEKETSAPLRLREGMVIIPAFNEEASIGALLDEVHDVLPGVECVVLSDGSEDHTADIARAKGATVLNLPCNVGVGGAVQAGFQYALQRNCRWLVRIDGDGQHPPSEIPRLIEAMNAGDADLIIGSRFGAGNSMISTRFRYLGIGMLALFLSAICRKRVKDPTSGFWMLDRKLVYYFAHHYPTDYPEPEALALLRRQGYSYKEVPVTFRQRRAGVSSIRRWGTFYYAIKVGLALVVDRVRPVNTRFARANLKETA